MHQQADGWLDSESLQLVGQPRDLQPSDLHRLDLHRLDLHRLDLQNLDLQSLDLQRIDAQTIDMQSIDRQRIDRAGLAALPSHLDEQAAARIETGIRALPPVGMAPNLPGDLPLRAAAGKDIFPQSSQLVFNANAAVEGFVERRSAADRPVHPSRNLGWDLGWEGLNVPGRVRWLEAVVDRSANGVIDAELNAGLNSGLNAGSSLGSGTNSVVLDGGDFAGRALESFASLLHDTRNMVTALDLYCGLLEEPGVLMEGRQHFATDLRIVASGSRRLLDKMGALDRPELKQQNETGKLFDLKSTAIDRTDAALVSRRAEDRVPRPYSFSAAQAQRTDALPSATLEQATPSLARRGGRFGIESGAAVESLAAELYANQNLLAALVGPGITLGLDVKQSRRPISMATDDLTRVLVNLARNAADAMPAGGHIQISLEEVDGQMSLSFADTGTGIPEAALESIFSPGVSTRIAVGSLKTSLNNPNEAIAWPSQHRGLGLAIVRSIVSAAGGTVWAANRRTELPSLSSSLSTLDSGRDASLSASRDSTMDSSREKTESVIPINGSYEPNRGALIMIEFPLPK